MTKEHPEILIEDTPHHYGIDVFNRCEQSGAVLLTLDGWKDIHPSLVLGGRLFAYKTTV